MEYIKCSECGQLVDKNENSCPNCGCPFNKHEEIVDVKICPECKKAVDSALSSCSNCGYPFDEGDDFEKILQETEQKVHEQELKTLEAERKLKELQEESERKKLEEEKKKKQEEREKQIAESNKKMEEVQKRAIEAERKLKELQEKNEQKRLEEEKKKKQEEREKQIAESNKKTEEVHNREIIAGRELAEGDEEQKEEIKEANESDRDENELTFVEKVNKSNVIDVMRSTLENNDKIKKTILKNRKIFLLGGVLVFVLIGVLSFASRGTPVESIELEYTNASLDVGSIGQLDYTITPSDATNKDVTWKTSDDSIVSVDKNGLLVGKKEGTCKITVRTKNGKTAECTITVGPAGPDLQAVYYQCCDSDYASVAADGSYLTIDTKPESSYQDYESEEAILSIFAVNEELGIPDSVAQKMGATRAIDGVQTQICGDIEVRWSYHPDNGLEVIYSLIE